MSQSNDPFTFRASFASIASAIAALIAGATLRFWMLHKFFEVNGDSQLYGAMAKSLLLHGAYAVPDQNGVLQSTLIRLPGYPLFLAACFRLFGMENYFAPACVQIVLELAGCVLLARLAARITPGSWRMSAAQATLWLAAMCPFTAIYAAEPLTEALSLFCIAVALWAAARFQDQGDWPSALAFTFAVTCAALLRPDGALVGISFAPAIVVALFLRPTQSRAPSSRLTGVPGDRSSSLGWSGAGVGNHKLRKILVCLLLALTPFAAWTVRNYRVFHVIQPLAPRYATDPGENTWPGWQRWVKTWALDFVSTYQIYWNMPAAPINIAQLPSRAFDSPRQYAQTAQLIADYEASGEEMSPALDARFAQLARERIANHPLRYYLVLPLGRVADMLFRPRVENLPIDLDWWVYSHHYAETRFSWFYAGLNAFYILLAIGGLCMRPRLWPWMLLYIVLRCALLTTIEAPEARYTLEFFPIFFVLGGIAMARLLRTTSLLH
ncbi:MAG TPA: glycosyltransferase family 39 protein [Terracidiphilus sp.]|nr:glycosyltransferase family 39 protein [Terracidiphilus sp.]